MCREKNHYRVAHGDIKQMIEHGRDLRFAGRALVRRKEQLGRNFERFGRKMLKCCEKTGSKYAKLASNRLWGLLSERWVRRYEARGHDVVLEDGVLFVDWDEKNTEKLLGRPVNQPSYIRLPWIGTFVTSFGRKIVNNYIGSMRSSIIRLNTDGWIIGKKYAAEYFNGFVSLKAGSLKIEAVGTLTAFDNINNFKIEGEKNKYAGTYKKEEEDKNNSGGQSLHRYI